MTVISRKEVMLSKKDKPWMTPFLRQRITDRWNAFRAHDWKAFNRLKMEISTMIPLAKKKWVDNCYKSSNDLWKVVNSITRQKWKTSSLETLGILLHLLVDELNTQFKTAFNSEPESPAMCGYDTAYVPDNLDNWLPFVDEQWTYAQLNRLDVSKSCGMLSQTEFLPVRLMSSLPRYLTSSTLQ